MGLTNKYICVCVYKYVLLDECVRQSKYARICEFDENEVREYQ